jgi:hypothetical protein
MTRAALLFHPGLRTLRTAKPGEHPQEMEVSEDVTLPSGHRTMDLDRLMDRVVSCCSKILSADTLLSYLWDRGSQTLRPSRHLGLSHKLVPQFKTDTLEAVRKFQATMLEARKPFLLLREKVPQRAGTQQLICTPLSDVGDGMAPSSVIDPFHWLSHTAMFIASADRKDGPAGPPRSRLFRHRASPTGAGRSSTAFPGRSRSRWTRRPCIIPPCNAPWNWRTRWRP